MRTTAKKRKRAIIMAALKLAETRNYAQLTRDAIAEEAGVSGPLIMHYFATMDDLRLAIIRAAIAWRVLPVIAQAIANQEPLDIDPGLRAAALETLK